MEICKRYGQRNETWCGSRDNIVTNFWNKATCKNCIKVHESYLAKEARQKRGYTKPKPKPVKRPEPNLEKLRDYWSSK